MSCFVVACVIRRQSWRGGP